MTIRRLLVVVAVLLVAGVIAAAVVVPRLIDPERYRGRVEALASEALERPVTIESLDVSWWPLGLRVDGLSASAIDDEPPGEVLAAASIRIGARLRPLLSGTLDITSLDVVGPTLRIIRGEDGALYAPSPPASDDAPDGGGPSVRLDGIELRDGRILLVDPSGRELAAIGALDARLAGLDAGPISLEGSARVDVDPGYDLRLSATVPAGAGGVSVDATAVLENADDRLDARFVVYAEGTGRIEVEIAPSTISGATLRRLLPVVLDPPPIEILDAGPTELSGRVVVPLGEGATPTVDLDATIRGMSLDAGLGRPLEEVAARVALTTELVSLREFRGRLGSTDVAGTVEIVPEEVPRLTIDLRSRRADLDEFLAGLSGETGDAPPTTGAGQPAAAEPLPRVRGTLRIEQGTLDAVDFSDTTATVDIGGTTVRLDPLSTRLYDGGFNGSLRVELAQDPPRIALTGRTDGIDLGALTADAFAMPNVLDGTLDADVDTTMAGLDVPALLMSALGQATVRVGDGVLGTLNLFDSLAGVSGVFGERARAELADRIGSDGTSFSTALGRLELDRGTMHVRELAIESPAFSLGGTANVDLRAGTLDGRFVLRLPEALSATMRADGNRAAEIFWNARSKRVEIPFTLAGPFSRPLPGIDFKTAAGTALRDRAESELQNLIRERLGAPGEPAPAAPADAAAPTPAQPEPEPEPIDPNVLGARITGHRWSGSILAKDLRLSGTVHGPSIASARVVVRDARGIEVRERAIAEVDQHLAGAEDPAAPTTIDWQLKIDGERLVLAKFPLAVTVEVTGADGATATGTRDVDR